VAQLGNPRLHVSIRSFLTELKQPARTKEQDSLGAQKRDFLRLNILVLYFNKRAQQEKMVLNLQDQEFLRAFVEN